MTPATNITPEHCRAFEALTNSDMRNFALFSCFVDGEPTAAIIAVNQDGDDFVFTPLFVAVTPKMNLTDQDGVRA